MKTILKLIFLPALAIIIYLLVQLVCTIPMGIMLYLNPEADQSFLLGLTLLVSSILTASIILMLPQFGLSGAYRGVGANVPNTILAISGAVCALFASNIFNEWLDLPNAFEELFVGMSGTVCGMIAIGIVGPITEEIVFRGGLMKPLLDRGVNPWIAIVGSALIFGLIHGNPAQIPYAMLIGIVFGIIYYRTGSLVITTLCHVLNNSVSVVLMNIYGAETDDMTFASMFGDTGTIVVFITFLALTVLFLCRFWKQTA